MKWNGYKCEKRRWMHVTTAVGAGETDQWELASRAMYQCSCGASARRKAEKFHAAKTVHDLRKGALYRPFRLFRLCVKCSSCGLGCGLVLTVWTTSSLTCQVSNKTGPIVLLHYTIAVPTVTVKSSILSKRVCAKIHGLTLLK